MLRILTRHERRNLVRGRKPSEVPQIHIPREDPEELFPDGLVAGGFQVGAYGRDATLYADD